MPSFSSNADFLKWPVAIKPTSITAPIMVSSTTFKSPLSFTSQTFTRPAAQFLLNAEFAPLNSKEQKEILTFIAKLRGQAGRFYFAMNPCAYGIPDAYAPERVTMMPLTADNTEITSDSEEVTVDAENIAYESFFASDGLSDDPTIITGTLWINSGYSRLEVGNYLSFDDDAGYRHLHLIVDVVTSGVTSVTVEPPMRFTPTASTPIHIKAPSGIFKVTEDTVGALTRQATGKGTFSLEAEQAWPARFDL